MNHDARVTELLYFLGDEAAKQLPSLPGCKPLVCNKTKKDSDGLDSITCKKCKEVSRYIKILRKINDNEEYNPQDE